MRPRSALPKGYDWESLLMSAAQAKRERRNAKRRLEKRLGAYRNQEGRSK